MQTSSHNIANINTPGYSRQRALIVTATPDLTQNFLIGRGIDMAGVQRLRDEFIDTQKRDEMSGLGGAETLEETYLQLESLFAEPSESGLSSRLTAFWNSWQELSNNPEDQALRSSLRNRASTMTTTFHRLDDDLSGLQTQLNEKILSEVAHVNSLAQRLDELNHQIKSIVFQGREPNDLWDEQARLLQELSAAADVSVLPQDNGSVQVHLHGTFLVDEAGPHLLETVVRPGDPLRLVDVAWADTGEALGIRSGRLLGLLDARDVVVADFRSRLDALADGVVSQVNALHSQGLGLDGARQIIGSTPFLGTLASNTSVDINGQTVTLSAGDNVAAIAAAINAAEVATGVHASINASRLVLAPSSVNGQTVRITADPSHVMLTLGVRNNFLQGTTAATIDLSTAVKTDLNTIAASVGGAPGDNSNALAIAGLRDALTMVGNTVSLGGFHQLLVTDLGSQSAAAQAHVLNQNSVIDQLTALEQNTSGVSLDEEAVNLMTMQKSYEMSAKLISTVDEMLDTLLNMVRR